MPDARERADRENDSKALIGDVKVYDACYDKNFAGSECAPYQLRATDNPEYWPFPNVPPLKWPEAPKERVYKPGMTPVQYFEALCKVIRSTSTCAASEAEGSYERTGPRPRILQADPA